MSHRFIIAIGTLTILVVAVTLWVVPSASEFSTSNPSWNGLQQAHNQFALHGLRSLNLLSAQAVGTALVVIPAVPFSPRDLEAIKRYTVAGGILFLMDDIGYGNAILAHLGVEARLSGQLLVDPLFAYKNRRFPRITELVGPAAEGVYSIVLNHATVLTGTTRMMVLARSSPSSFLSRTQSGRREPGDPLGPFAVAGLQRVGAGSVVVISDSSLLLNSMLGLANNRRFVQNLFHLAGVRPQVYLDKGHLPRAPLDVAKDWLSRARGVLAFPPLAFLAATVSIALLWKNPGR